MKCVTAISPSNLDKKFLGDHVINPYLGCEHGCLHCYCPAMPGVRCFNGGRRPEEWGSYIEPKEGLIGALEKQLKCFTPEKAVTTPSGDGWVLMSYLTDPYTPLEASLKLTRGCLERLLDAGHKVRIQTRSAMVKRDFDILKAYPGRVLLGTSLPYLDDNLARVLEPGASGPTARIHTLGLAADAGIATFVAIAPFFPFHGEVRLAEVAAKAKDAFSPQEIFCEVVNPKGNCIDRVATGLENATRKEHRAFASVLRDYTPAKWAEFTHRILSFGDHHIDGFIPWPDTSRGWRKHLPEEKANYLDQFIPR